MITKRYETNATPNTTVGLIKARLIFTCLLLKLWPIELLFVIAPRGHKFFDDPGDEVEDQSPDSSRRVDHNANIDDRSLIADIPGEHDHSTKKEHYVRGLLQKVHDAGDLHTRIPLRIDTIQHLIILLFRGFVNIKTPQYNLKRFKELLDIISYLVLIHF